MGGRGLLMAVLFLLLSFCSRSCAVTLQQSSAIAAMVGSSVNLSCSLQLGEETVTEQYPYWFMPQAQTNGKNNFFIYPHVTTDIPTNISQSSLRRTNPKNKDDMTITIADVRLRYTGTYVCHMSVRIDGKKRGVFGNGTYLLVHEPLDTSINATSVICRTEVQAVVNVTLSWEIEGGSTGNITHQSLQNSYGISNELLIEDIVCRGQKNVTAICSLQYMGTTLTNKSIEIPCTGSYTGQLKKSQPALLYAMLLASPMLILLIVILVFFMRRKHKRKNVPTHSYTNLQKK